MKFQGARRQQRRPTAYPGSSLGVRLEQPDQGSDADESLPAAAILLRRAQDPVAAKLDAAPYDDEELTDEDLRAVKEARNEPGISWSDAEAELNAG